MAKRPTKKQKPTPRPPTIENHKSRRSIDQYGHKDKTALNKAREAFRDMLALGIHSCLTCFRDRLLLAKELSPRRAIAIREAA